MATLINMASKLAEESPEVRPADVIVSPPKKPRSGGGDEGEGASIDALFKLMTAMSAKLDTITTQLALDREEIKDTNERVARCELRVEELEPRVAHVEDSMTTVTRLEKKVQDLERAAVDQENRSRRNNLRIFGVPESVEKASMEAFLESWIPKLLDMSFTPSLEVQRAHRVPSRRSSEPGKGPRPIVAYFLRFSQVKAILEKAKSLGQVSFMGQNIFIAPDYARATAALRKRFLEFRPRLRALGASFGLMYPARMIVTQGNKSLEFEEPEDLHIFLSEQEALLDPAMDTSTATVPTMEKETGAESSTKQWSALFKDTAKRAFLPQKERRRQRSPRNPRKSTQEDRDFSDNRDLRSPIK